MRLIGNVRPIAANEIVAAGHDRGSAYDALSTQVPEGFDLIQAHFTMKDGVTTAKGVIRATRTEDVVADGADYDSANAALEAQVPDGYVLLGRTIVD